MLPLHYEKIYAFYLMRHFDVCSFSSVLVSFWTFYLFVDFIYTLTNRARVHYVRVRVFVYVP